MRSQDINMSRDALGRLQRIESRAQPDQWDQIAIDLGGEPGRSRLTKHLIIKQFTLTACT